MTRGKVTIAGKEVDMSRSVYSTSTYYKIGEVGTNMIFANKGHSGFYGVSWLLTPENSSPNPCLSKNMVIGRNFSYCN